MGKKQEIIHIFRKVFGTVKCYLIFSLNKKVIWFSEEMQFSDAGADINFPLAGLHFSYISNCIKSAFIDLPITFMRFQKH